MTKFKSFKTVLSLCCLPVLFCYCILAYAQQAAQSQPLLEATVERQTVIDGESVLLYVKGEGLTQLPDVSSLSKQFDVIDSRRSNSQVIDNGVVKSQFLMRFELLPKNLGQTVIPSFTADGVSSQPVTINVVERGTPGVVPRDKVFAELTLDKSSVYVQAQAVLSLNILDDGSLASVDPPLPVIPDVQVEKLPGGDQRIEMRNGEEYRVHTWRYALFPQRQGQIEIPRLPIPGSVRDPNYGGGLIMRSMATRRIQIRTNDLTLNATPRAAASTADWWLPVQQLQLQHEWSADISDITAGEPLTLTMTLNTAGATSNQLPEIDVPAIDGVKIYPDVPSLQSRATETGLISQRQEKWSVIPQKAGQVRLPAVTIKWWDTAANAERQAVVPEQTLVVKADPTKPVQAAPVTPPAFASESSSNTPGTNDQDLLVDGSTGPTDINLSDNLKLWRTIALFALFGWLVTSVTWALLSRNGSKKRKVNDEKGSTAAAEFLLKKLGSSQLQANPSRFREHLLSWAKQQWPEETSIGPPDIARKLGCEELASELKLLEASLYSNSAASANPVRINSLLLAGLERLERQGVEKDHLPPL